MADPYGLELSGLDPADSAELRKIKNRQALADQMTQIGLTPIRGTMAGRVYAAPSWTQGLAQLASAYVGKKMGEEADEGYKGVAERQKQRIADEMMKVKDLYHGKEAIAPATPMDDEGNKMPMVQEAQAPNPRAAIEQAMLSNNPMLQRYGMMLNQGEESKLARAENAANRAEMYKLQVEENKRRDAQRVDDKEALVRLTAGLRQPPAPSIATIVDPTDPTKMISVDTRTYKGGGMGSAGVIGGAGKEPAAQKKAESVDAGREQVNAQVAQLRDYYTQLSEGGGITDPSKGGMSNLGAAIASSGIGQTIGGAFGTKNQSIRNSISQQRPLLLQAIKQATGMSAKQMDSNAELKMLLAAATDPTLDIKSNLEALDNLDRLYGLGGGTSKKPASGTWQAKTPDEVKALYQNGTISKDEAKIILREMGM